MFLDLLKSFVLILCFLFLIPFITTFFAFFYLYRGFISFLHKVLADDNSANILNPQSSMFYDEHLKHSVKVQVQAKLNGKIDFRSFCERFQEKVIDAKLSNGRLKYPELRQNVYSWLGYNFWIEEKVFNINDHLKCYEYFDCESPSVRDEDFCQKLILETIHADLPVGKSEWIILLVPNVVLGNSSNLDKGTLLLFQFPHYMGDGYSIFQLIIQCADEAQVELYQPKLRPNKCESCLQLVCCPFSLITKSVEKSVNIDSDKFWTNLPPNAALDADNSNPFLRSFVLSKSIPTDGARRLAKSFNVSFSSLLLCAFQNGVQRFFEKRGKVVPDQWSTLFPIPSLNRTSSLINDVYFVLEDMPTNKNETFPCQIKNYDERLIEIKKSSSNLFFGTLLYLLGLLPKQLRSAAVNVENSMRKKKYDIDFFFTIFPGPKDKVHLLGQFVAEMNFIAEVVSNSPIYFTVMIYNGQLQFWLGCLAELFTIDETRELLEYIEREFNNMNDGI